MLEVLSKYSILFSGGEQFQCGRELQRTKHSRILPLPCWQSNSNQDSLLRTSAEMVSETAPPGRVFYFCTSTTFNSNLHLIQFTIPRSYYVTYAQTALVYARSAWSDETGHTRLGRVFNYLWLEASCATQWQNYSHNCTTKRNVFLINPRAEGI